MELIQRTIDDVLVVSFAQRVNLEGQHSTEFKEELKGLIAAGFTHVVVDLGNVGFVDSQGLGALISCLKVLRQANGSLSLINLSDSIAAVLRITRLIRVFEVFDSVDEAAAACAVARRSLLSGHGA